MGQEASTQFEQLGLANTVTNPLQPLYFQHFSDDTSNPTIEISKDDECLLVDSSFSMDAHALRMSVDECTPYNDPDFVDAARRALEAGCDEPQKAIIKAKQILDEIQVCEAYLVLAKYSKSFQEGLKYYQKAQQAFYASVDKDELKDILKKREIWLYPTCRGFFRAIYGEAVCHFFLKQYDKSLKCLEKLLKLDPKDHFFMSSWFNYKYLIAEVLMHMKDWKRADQYIRKNLETFTRNSTMIASSYHRVLLHYVLGKCNSFCDDYWKYGSELLENEDAGIVMKAISNAYQVVPFLSGEKKLPNQRIPGSFTTKHNIFACAQYAMMNKELWER